MERWRVDYDYLDEKGAVRDRCVPFADEATARRFVELLSHMTVVQSAKLVPPEHLDTAQRAGQDAQYDGEGD